MSTVTRWGRPAVLVALLAFGAVFPLVFTAPLTTDYAIDTLLFVGGVVAWNMFSGYSGYISLGQAVFFGCGGYTVALIATHNMELARHMDRVFALQDGRLVQQRIG